MSALSLARHETFAVWCGGVWPGGKDAEIDAKHIGTAYVKNG
jgi:uncharacterized protein YdgA (DUF945 family)